MTTQKKRLIVAGGRRRGRSRRQLCLFRFPARREYGSRRDRALRQYRHPRGRSRFQHARARRKHARRGRRLGEEGAAAGDARAGDICGRGRCRQGRGGGPACRPSTACWREAGRRRSRRRAPTSRRSRPISTARAPTCAGRRSWRATQVAALQKLDQDRARAKSLAAQLQAAQQRLSLAIQGPRSEDIAAARAQLQAREADLALAQQQLDYTKLYRQASAA